MFNGLDYLIVSIFVVIIGVGFFNGVTKLTSAIIGIYFGAIFAAAFYRSTAAAVVDVLSSMNLRTGELACFLLLFLAFALTFSVILSRWLGDIRLPRRIAILDHVGGAALGVIVSGLVVTLASLVFAITLQALNQTATVSGQAPGLALLGEQIRSSTLVPLFLRMSPFFVQILSPWFPGGLPPILNLVQ